MELLFGSNKIMEPAENILELLGAYEKDSQEFQKRKTAYHLYD